jgi:hypothetical protein
MAQGGASNRVEETLGRQYTRICIRICIPRLLRFRSIGCHETCVARTPHTAAKTKPDAESIAGVSASGRSFRRHEYRNQRMSYFNPAVMYLQPLSLPRRVHEEEWKGQRSNQCYRLKDLGSPILRILRHCLRGQSRPEEKGQSLIP